MKNKNKKKHQQKNMLLYVACIFAIIAIAVVFVAKGAINVKEEPTVSTTDSLIITKSELTDQAKFYPYEVNGIQMEVLAFVASDNSVRTALNTCQICYNSGRGYYVKQGDVLICQNCGNRFSADQVEIIKGGCNPVPITAENKLEDDSTITISEEFLAQNTKLFENWR